MTTENTNPQATAEKPAQQQEQTSQPTVEQLRAENERLQREYADATKRLSDKDNHISQLSNEKATLEQRFNATNSQKQEDADIAKEATAILAEAADDPDAAGKRLATLIKKAQDSGVKTATETVNHVVTQREKINKLRAENQDLLEIGLEVPITMRANELMQQGRSFDDATQTAVTEFRTRLKGKLVEKPKQPEGKTNNEEIPAGAKGETGGSSLPAKKAETTNEVDPTSGTERVNRLSKTGLY